MNASATKPYLNNSLATLHCPNDGIHFVVHITIYNFSQTTHVIHCLFMHISLQVLRCCNAEPIFSNHRCIWEPAISLQLIFLFLIPLQTLCKVSWFSEWKYLYLFMYLKGYFFFVIAFCDLLKIKYNEFR